MNLIHMAHCALLVKSICELLHIKEPSKLFHDDDGIILDENFTYIKKTDELHQIIKKASVVYNYDKHLLLINYAKADELIEIFNGICHELYKAYQLHSLYEDNLESPHILKQWEEDIQTRARDALCFCEHISLSVFDQHLDVYGMYQNKKDYAARLAQIQKQYPQEDIAKLFKYYKVNVLYFMHTDL